jgi:hypothetical protein
MCGWTVPRDWAELEGFSFGEAYNPSVLRLRTAVQVKPAVSRRKEGCGVPKLLEGLSPRFLFGARVWGERRLRFRATIALAELTRQNSG